MDSPLMADSPIINFTDIDKYDDDNHTPDFSEISIDENEPNPTNDFRNTPNEPQHQQLSEYHQLNEMSNDPNKGLDGNEIRNIIEQMFPESLKDNAKLVLTNDVFTTDHFKSFLKIISTQFNDLKKSKQQELQNQLQKLKKQLNEKEDKREQIENLQKQLQEKEQEQKELKKKIHENEYYKQQFEKLQKQKEKKEQENQNFILNLLNFKKGKKQMTPQENELMNENDDLVKRLDTLDKMFEQLRLENLEKKQNIENLNKENKYLCIQNSELNDDNCYLDKKIGHLTNEKTTLETYLKQQNKQFKKLETTITNLKKDCLKLEKEKKQVDPPKEKKQTEKTLKQTENQLTKEINEVSTKEKEKEELNKEQSDEINELTKENENLKQHDLTTTKDEEININDRKEIKEKNVFELDYVPSKNALFKSYLVSIPIDYNKDVYYFDYQNRQELFGSSKHDHIPVYFPIPVLKGETYTIFFYKPSGSWFFSEQLLRVVVVPE
ncbi:hypothetical protein QTN25_004879 [Entamoeba marina]